MTRTRVVKVKSVVLWPLHNHNNSNQRQSSTTKNITTTAINNLEPFQSWGYPMVMVYQCFDHYTITTRYTKQLKPTQPSESSVLISLWRNHQKILITFVFPMFRSMGWIMRTDSVHLRCIWHTWDQLKGFDKNMLFRDKNPSGKLWSKFWLLNVNLESVWPDWAIFESFLRHFFQMLPKYLKTFNLFCENLFWKMLTFR